MLAAAASRGWLSWSRKAAPGSSIRGYGYSISLPWKVCQVAHAVVFKHVCESLSTSHSCWQRRVLATFFVVHWLLGRALSLIYRFCTIAASSADFAMRLRYSRLLCGFAAIANLVITAVAGARFENKIRMSPWLRLSMTRIAPKTIPSVFGAFTSFYQFHSSRPEV